MKLLAFNVATPYCRWSFTKPLAEACPCSVVTVVQDTMAKSSNPCMAMLTSKPKRRSS